MPKFLAGSIQQPVEQRRWDLSRNSSVQVTLQQISGRVLVTGTGEVSVDVTFPVLFAEPPAFWFGGELNENHWPEAGNYPTVSVVVASWDIQERSTFGRFWKGATLAVYVTGKVDQELWVHWHVEAKAFQNPIGPGDSTDQTL